MFEIVINSDFLASTSGRFLDNLLYEKYNFEF